MQVAIDPRQRDSLERWLVRSNAAIAHPFKANNDTVAINAWFIDVATGSEEQALSELRAFEWVFDARRIGADAGPDAAMIDFALSTIISSNSTQSSLYNRLKGALLGLFGSAFVNEATLTIRRGLEYEWTIGGSMPKLLPNVAGFSGRWLNTKVVFKFFKTGDFDGPSKDRLLLDIPDGFLPTWPDNAASAPPENHTIEFHLRPGDRSKYKNFYVLVKLQKVIATKIGVEWDGEAFVPGYFE